MVNFFFSIIYAFCLDIIWCLANTVSALNPSNSEINKKKKNIQVIQTNVHLHWLSSLCCPPKDALEPWLLTECLAKTDQTAQMHRLMITYHIYSNI